ncbi:MAG TPA: bifunctional diaminohydroxyphosphoribosylaminopyrimidine deaminase/5-amino-6-(5-phosphoribosylamino)uracil reductase RibD [Rhizomicrobium sp.]|nr:bifunctional diaminohydroxyphosphoribosylaminopyrimidine deaminase/5-amino-6-(5-phosphoribosylamino)uracil reductase RibD [Rhizomicrobium sp.]
MRHALRLAERGLGLTAPNPAVGCIIVSRDNRVVGCGWTGRGGRPHAEAVALAEAGNKARGGTAYVTLEPCAHHGKTPPCAAALVQAGIARVVAAAADPDPRVDGAGFERLRAAGVEVVIRLLEDEASELNAGFLLRMCKGRPLVTLKIAASADGRTASASGDSQWITGGDARRFGHLLRARHDAILVGIETVIADDPSLTCRLPGLEDRSPVRIVLDTQLRLPQPSKLVQTAREIPTWVFTVAEGGDELRACGVDIFVVGRDARGRPDLAAMLRTLADRGITRLLVEGGAGVHASFIDRGFADRVECFRAPMMLGAAGQPAIGSLAALGLDEALRFTRTGTRRFGSDLLESFRASH